MATSRISCPRCNTALGGGTELIGRRIKCPKCSQVFMAGAPGTLRLEEVRPVNRKPRGAKQGPNLVPIVVILLLLAGSGVGAYFVMTAFKPNDQTQAKITTKGQTTALGTSGETLPVGPGGNPVPPVNKPNTSGTTDATLPRATGKDGDPGKTSADPGPKKIEPPTPEPMKIVPPVEPPKLDPPKKPDPTPPDDPNPALPKPDKTQPKGGVDPHTVLSAVNQKRVNDAIDKAVAYLKKNQLPDGTWGDHGFPLASAALPGLTLLECGLPATDEQIKKAAAFVRFKAHTYTSRYTTYELSLAVLFLDRLGNPNDVPLIRYLTLRLLAGQYFDGSWSYDSAPLEGVIPAQLLDYLGKSRPTPCLVTKQNTLLPLAPGVDPKSLPPGVAEPAFSIIDPKVLANSLQGLGLVNGKPATKIPTPQYPLGRKAEFPGGGGDNSNTQFAMIATWVARRHNIPVDRTMALVDQHFISTQHADGGWGYDFQKQSTNTMTCAGLIGLGLGHGGHKESLGAAWKLAGLKSPLEDPAIQAGLTYLSNFVGDAPEDWDQKVKQDNLYFVWSVERVAMLYGLKNIGGKEWYPWAAQMLVANQQADGSWIKGGYAEETPLVNSCLSLLVLKRVNLIQDLTPALQEFVPIENKKPGAK